MLMVRIPNKLRKHLGITKKTTMPMNMRKHHRGKTMTQIQIRMIVDERG